MAEQHYAPVITFLTAGAFLCLAVSAFSASPGDASYGGRYVWAVWAVLAVAFAYSGVRMLRTKADH